MIVIDAQQVEKIIPFGDEDITILEDVNLVVKQSETISIVGVSGSGKSTLLSLLAGLDKPTSGQITLLGHNLSECDENQLSELRQAQIGFVFQNFYLLPQFNALENVALACDIAGIDNSAAKAKEILTKVGLSHRLDHYPSHLSGGEQQRVALARAFVTKPKLIFADEPTGSLDEATGKAVIEMLYDLNDQYQTTLVVVTHDTVLSEQSQRIVKLHHGKLEDIKEVAS